MSVQQLGAVFERSRSRGGARLVLLSIANHDGDGGSWPTISTLCRESGLCKNSVHAALQKLQADGELQVHVQAGGTLDCPGHKRPNRYQILLPLPETGTPLPPETGTPPPPVSGTQTVLEPSKEPSVRALVDRAFLAFWEIYPRKTAKRTALQAYERAVQRVTAVDALNDRDHAIWKINTAAAGYAKIVKSTEDRFVKHPTTWLNGDCWEDEFGTRRRPVNDFPEEV